MCNNVSVAVGKEVIVVSIFCSFKYLYQVYISLFGSINHCCCLRCKQTEVNRLFALHFCDIASYLLLLIIFVG